MQERNLPTQLPFPLQGQLHSLESLQTRQHESQNFDHKHLVQPGINFIREKLCAAYCSLNADISTLQKEQ